MSKDYYKTLGVLDDAEDIVIRAAYKALAQRYHPDKWSGSAEEANKKMAEINEAYEILSNPEKRKKYDAEKVKSEYSEGEYEQGEEDELLSSLERDWLEVIEYFPDLQIYAGLLSKISKQLEFSFKSILLETKRYNDRNIIAKQLEEHYLQRYFGKNKKILQYAKKLILEGNKKAAKDLNRAIDLLGSDVDPDLIIQKVGFKNRANNDSWSSSVNIHDALKYAEQFIGSPCVYYAKCLIESMGGFCIQSRDNLSEYSVEYEHKNYEFDHKELMQFSLETANRLLNKRN